MTWAGRVRHRWQLAGRLARAEDSGHVLMAIPEYLASEVYALRWRRNVEEASDRWAARVDDIPVTVWQDAVAHMGRHRLAKPRRGETGKVLPVDGDPRVSRPGLATAGDNAVD